MVKGAPGVDADGHIGDSENEALYEYYAGYLGDSSPPPPARGRRPERPGPRPGAPGGHPRRSGRGQPGAQGRDTSGPTTDEAMTRSEERLHVGTEQAETGRVRLRKHIVTENVTPDRADQP